MKPFQVAAFHESMLAAHAAIAVHQAIPPQLREALDRYAAHGYRTGDFLYAVLCDRFSEAVGRADPGNKRLLPEIRDYVLEHVPDSAWGSEAKVEAWIETNADRRREAREDADAREDQP